MSKPNCLVETDKTFKSLLGRELSARLSFINNLLTYCCTFYMHYVLESLCRPIQFVYAFLNHAPFHGKSCITLTITYLRCILLIHPDTAHG